MFEMLESPRLTMKARFRNELLFAANLASTRAVHMSAIVSDVPIAYRQKLRVVLDDLAADRGSGATDDASGAPTATSSTALGETPVAVASYLARRADQ